MAPSNFVPSINDASDTFKGKFGPLEIYMSYITLQLLPVHLVVEP